jgi:hypothetical protein
MKQLVKNTLLFAAIGLAVGLAAPYVGSFLLAQFGLDIAAASIPAGVSALSHATSLATTFGLFGAASTLLTPVFSAIFGKDNVECDHAHTNEQTRTTSRSHQMTRTRSDFADKELARREAEQNTKAAHGIG